MKTVPHFVINSWMVSASTWSLSIRPVWMYLVTIPLAVDLLTPKVSALQKRSSYGVPVKFCFSEACQTQVLYITDKTAAARANLCAGSLLIGRPPSKVPICFRHGFPQKMSRNWHAWVVQYHVHFSHWDIESARMFVISISHEIAAFFQMIVCWCKRLWELTQHLVDDLPSL